jgi:hypothetical protein
MFLSYYISHIFEVSFYSWSHVTAASMSFHQFYYVNSVFIDFLVITLLKLYFLSVGTCYIECVLLFMSVG